jgi:hypothetical protein
VVSVEIPEEFEYSLTEVRICIDMPPLKRGMTIVVPKGLAIVWEKAGTVEKINGSSIVMG